MLTPQPISKELSLQKKLDEIMGVSAIEGNQSQAGAALHSNLLLQKQNQMLQEHIGLLQELDDLEFDRLYTRIGKLELRLAEQVFQNCAQAAVYTRMKAVAHQMLLCGGDLSGELCTDYQNQPAEVQKDNRDDRKGEAAPSNAGASGDVRPVKKRKLGDSTGVFTHVAAPDGWDAGRRSANQDKSKVPEGAENCSMLDLVNKLLPSLEKYAGLDSGLTQGQNMQGRLLAAVARMDQVAKGKAGEAGAPCETADNKGLESSSPAFCGTPSALPPPPEKPPRPANKPTPSQCTDKTERPEPDCQDQAMSPGGSRLSEGDYCTAFPMNMPGKPSPRARLLFEEQEDDSSLFCKDFSPNCSNRAERPSSAEISSLIKTLADAQVPLCPSAADGQTEVNLSQKEKEDNSLFHPPHDQLSMAVPAGQAPVHPAATACHPDPKSIQEKETSLVQSPSVQPSLQTEKQISVDVAPNPKQNSQKWREKFQAFALAPMRKPQSLLQPEDDSDKETRCAAPKQKVPCKQSNPLKPPVSDTLAAVGKDAIHFDLIPPGIQPKNDSSKHPKDVAPSVAQSGKKAPPPPPKRKSKDQDVKQHSKNSLSPGRMSREGKANAPRGAFRGRKRGGILRIGRFWRDIGTRKPPTMPAYNIEKRRNEIIFKGQRARSSNANSVQNQQRERDNKDREGGERPKMSPSNGAGQEQVPAPKLAEMTEAALSRDFCGPDEMAPPGMLLDLHKIVQIGELSPGWRGYLWRCELCCMGFDKIEDLCRHFLSQEHTAFSEDIIQRAWGRDIRTFASLKGGGHGEKESCFPRHNRLSIPHACPPPEVHQKNPMQSLALWECQICLRKYNTKDFVMHQGHTSHLQKCRMTCGI